MDLDRPTRIAARPASAGEGTYLLSLVLGGASSLYIGTIVQLAGRLVFAVVVARLLGADAVGVFTVGFVAVQALGMVATSGIEVGLYHFVSPAVKNGDIGTVKGMFWASVGTTAVLAFVLAVLYVMLVPFYPLASSVPGARLALQLFAPTLVLQVLVANNERFSGIPQSRVVLMKPEKRRVERARSGGSWGAMGISDGGGTWLRGFWWGDAVCGGGLYLGGSGLT